MAVTNSPSGLGEDFGCYLTRGAQESEFLFESVSQTPKPEMKARYENHKNIL